MIRETYPVLLPLCVATILLAAAAVMSRLRPRWPLWMSLVWRFAIFGLMTFLVQRLLGSPLHPHFSGPYSGMEFWEHLIEAGWWLLAAGAAVSVVRLLVKLENRPRETQIVSDLLAGAISIATLLAIAAISWIRSGPVGERSDNYLDIAIFAAALMGGVIGFLWFNAFPAEVFMGDTGSMALGGAIATLTILTETEVLLIFIGGIYLIEALSVIIQVASFKRTGRRVFLMAPIHHHFEMKAWSETKIMVRFWIVGAIFCTTGFVLFYRYYLRFKL